MSLRNGLLKCYSFLSSAEAGKPGPFNPGRGVAGLAAAADQSGGVLQRLRAITDADTAADDRYGYGHQSAAFFGHRR